MSGSSSSKQRRLSHIELAEVVKTHQDFLLGRPGGLRAQLVQHDLSGMLLTGSNLKDADLTGANLADADLSDCVLDGALMFGANLSDANLEGARMVGADLRGATLRVPGSTGPSWTMPISAARTYPSRCSATPRSPRSYSTAATSPPC